MTNWPDLITVYNSALNSDNSMVTPETRQNLLKQVREPTIEELMPNKNILMGRSKLIQIILSDFSKKPFYKCLIDWTCNSHYFRREYPLLLFKLLNDHLPS